MLWHVEDKWCGSLYAVDSLAGNSSSLRCGDRGQVPLETVWWGQEVKEQTGGLFSQWLNQGQFCSCIKTDSWFSSSWMSLISSDYCLIPHWHSCESHKTKCRYCMCVFRQKTEEWSGLFKEFWPLNLFSLFFKWGLNLIGQLRRDWDRSWDSNLCCLEAMLQLFNPFFSLLHYGVDTFFIFEFLYDA